MDVLLDAASEETLKTEGKKRSQASPMEDFFFEESGLRPLEWDWESKSSAHAYLASFAGVDTIVKSRCDVTTHLAQEDHAIELCGKHTQEHTH